MRDLLRPMLVSVLFCAMAAGSGEYAVKFDRPDKTGMKFDVAVVGAQKEEVDYSIDGKSEPSEPQVVAVQLEARAEVLEADEKGRDLKVAYKINKCVKVVDDKESEILPKGKTLIARWDGSATALELKDGMLDDEQQRYLGLVAHVDDPQGIGFDEMYGTAQRQKVGATWGINPDAILAAAKREDVTAKKEDVSGTIKLTSSENSDGIEWLSISGQSKLTNGQMPMPANWNLPRGVRLKDVSIDFDFTVQVPADTSLGNVRSSTNYTRTMRVAGTPGGREYKYESRSTFASETRVTPVKE